MFLYYVPDEMGSGIWLVFYTGRLLCPNRAHTQDLEWWSVTGLDPSRLVRQFRTLAL